MNFKLTETESEPDRLYHKMQLKEVFNGNLKFEKITHIYVELAKFTKSEDDLLNHFDQWIYILSHSEHFKKTPKHIKEPVFMELLEKSKLLSLSPEERANYEYELKVYRDNYNTMEYAKKRAKIEGHEKGLQEGRLEEKRELILNGFDEGLSISMLSKISKLSEDEVIRIIEARK